MDAIIITPEMHKYYYAVCDYLRQISAESSAEFDLKAPTFEEADALGAKVYNDDIVRSVFPRVETERERAALGYMIAKYLPNMNDGAKVILPQGVDAPDKTQELTKLIDKIRDDIEQYKNCNHIRAVEYLSNAISFAGIRIDDNGGYQIMDQTGKLVSLKDYKYKENCMDALSSARQKASSLKIEQDVALPKKPIGMDR